MTATQRDKTKRNIFLRIHPVQRIFISLAAALLVFFLIRKANFGNALIATSLWDVFALSYTIISWIVLYTRSHAEIIKLANTDDGSRPFVLISILITSFASMFAVLMLLLSKDLKTGNELIALIIAVGGMLLSWVMVHTLFTFHYAHMYYAGYEEHKNKGLEFPGNTKPDYLDFAYFSFVVGMTFQVSDVEIASPKIRRTVLAHGLLAFALNTFVVALTINLIAGLKNS